MLMYNSRCEWNGNFNIDTSTLDCVIKFCDNLTSAPDTSKMSYEWDGNLVSIDTNVVYPCDADHALESGVLENKEDSATQIEVPCASDGTMTYPDPWPVCLDNVNCADPWELPTPADITTSWVKEAVVNYNDTVHWRCKDRRYEIRSTLSGDQTTYSRSVSCLYPNSNLN